MRIVSRSSVAVAMTFLVMIVTLMFISFSSTEESGWSRFNTSVLISFFIAGAGAAWLALGEGTKPTKLAPIVASLWLFLIAVAALGYFSGVELAAAGTSRAPIPEPAATIFLVVSALCAVYVVAMGFWLVKRDD